LHGRSLSSDSWDDQALALAREFPGDRLPPSRLPRSAQTWGGYDCDSLSDDLAAAVDYARDPSVTPVAFSMDRGEVARHMKRHSGRALALQASLKSTLDCAEAFATTDFRPDLAHSPSRR
jgi:non-heme chloroperoxidase